MKRLLGFVALIVFAAQAGAQARLEAALKTNPNDRAARSALLDYYFQNGGLNPAQAIPARRRHILWLIQNAPADEMAGLPAATIDAAGHRLADPQGFKLASDAWRAQIARPDIGAMALANAARFFKLSDMGLTITLLERALTLEPANKEIGARLGDEYALAIMGVTMVNQNGFPTGADPRLTQSASARQAREALTTSRNPYTLAKAGYMLMWQGAILYYSGRLAFDTAPLAESAIQRAVSLAPGDPGVANYLEEYRAMQRELGQARPASARGANPVSPPPPAAPAPPPGPNVTADDLKTVTVGMNREQLLKLGQPAGRMTMSEGGHLIEIYQYSADGKSLGRVRLTDGTVSSMEIP
jgi:hypothetical protein